MALQSFSVISRFRINRMRCLQSSLYMNYKPPQSSKLDLFICSRVTHKKLYFVKCSKTILQSALNSKEQPALKLPGHFGQGIFYKWKTLRCLASYQPCLRSNFITGMIIIIHVQFSNNSISLFSLNCLLEVDLYEIYILCNWFYTHQVNGRQFWWYQCFVNNI